MISEKRKYAQFLCSHLTGTTLTRDETDQLYYLKLRRDKTLSMETWVAIYTSIQPHNISKWIEPLPPHISVTFIWRKCYGTYNQ